MEKRRIIFAVLFQFLAVVHSVPHASEIESIFDAQGAIVYILDACGKTLCIGVLVKNGGIMTHKEALGQVTTLSVKFPGSNEVHRSMIQCYFKDVVRLTFVDGLQGLGDFNVKYVDYLMDNPPCELYSTTIGWKEGRELARETLIIQDVTDHKIVTRRSTVRNADYEGHIGDPLFFHSKLVGILAEMQNGINIYANVGKTAAFYGLLDDDVNNSYR